MHDPVRFGVALIPLALYGLLLGILNLGRRPFVLSSARDTIALGVGLSGLMMIGPIELIAPENAVRSYGPYVWLMLAMLYSLVVTLVVLVQRPGIVIYNVSLDAFRPALARVVEALEPDPRWAGTTLMLPSQGIELHVETFAPLSNIRLTSVGDQQSTSGWMRLEYALRQALGQVEVRPQPIGAAFVLLAVLLAGSVSYSVAQDPVVVRKAFEQFIKLR
jgi:hypothetical protein